MVLLAKQWHHLPKRSGFRTGIKTGHGKKPKVEDAEGESMLMTDLLWGTKGTNRQDD